MVGHAEIRSGSRCLLLMRDGRWSGPLRRSLTKRAIPLTTCESSAELQSELQRTPDAAVTVELNVDTWQAMTSQLKPLQQEYSSAVWIGLLGHQFQALPLVLRQDGWLHLHQDIRRLDLLARMIQFHVQRQGDSRTAERAQAASLQELQIKIDSQLPWRDEL